MSTKIRIVILDDHAILRSGLRWLIGNQTDMEVVGESGDFLAGVHLIKAQVPDVVTLDLTMPGGTGLGSVSVLRTLMPSLRIIVLTMHDDPAYVRASLAAGANGYLVKSTADSELVSAIRAVHRGRVFIDTEHFRQVEPPVASFSHSTDFSRLDALSPREREVLTLLAVGHTNQAIADHLLLSVKTVESYRARLMQKLGLVSRAELTRLAIDLGLITKSAYTESKK